MKMATRHQIFWLLVLIVNQIQTTEATTYDYSFGGHVSIPGNIPLDVKELNLQGNLLTHISDQDFKKFPSLNILNLKQNRITNISEHAFDYNSVLIM